MTNKTHQEKANDMLRQAIALKNSFMVSSALQYGADPNHNSLLVDAIKIGNEIIVNLLLRAGADAHKAVVNPRNPEETLLHLAAKSGTVGVLKAIHEHFTDINVPDEDGNTPLHLALSDPEKVRYLIDAGANLNAANSDGDNPLHLVLDSASLNSLLKAGADTTIYNKKGQLPIHNPDRHVSCIRIFEENGANIHAQDKNGNTILHLMAKSKSHYYIDALMYGVNGDKPNEDGETALQIYFEKSTTLDGNDVARIVNSGYDFMQIGPILLSDIPHSAKESRRSISERLNSIYCAFSKEISTFADSAFEGGKELIKDNKPTERLLKIAGVGLLPELFDHPFLKNDPEKRLKFFRTLEEIFPEHCKEILHRQVDITKEQRLEVPDPPGESVKRLLSSRGAEQKRGVGGPS